jgi:hypothetical protein
MLQIRVEDPGTERKNWIGKTCRGECLRLGCDDRRGGVGGAVVHENDSI